MAVLRTVRVHVQDRLDRALRGCFEGSQWISRAVWSELFKERRISDQTGRKLSSHEILPQVPADIIIELPGEIPAYGIQLPSTTTPIVPLVKEQRFAAFSKPSGMHTIAQRPWESDCLGNHIAAYLEANKLMSVRDFSALGMPPSLEGGLAQRLDKETSGIVMCALDKDAKAALRKALSAGSVNKSYLAITEDVGAARMASKSFTVYLWGGNSKRSASLTAPESKREDVIERADLDLKVLCRRAPHTLVQVDTRDGFRHVVRLGLTVLGTPILGDALYNTAPDPTASLMLHAHTVRFTQDVRLADGSVLVPAEKQFEAPLPVDFANTLKRLHLTLPQTA